jgi:hypothetical protein
MKKKSTSQSAFFNLRVLIGLFVVLAGVFLALLGFGTFSKASAQTNANSAAQAQGTGQMTVIPALHSDVSLPLREQPIVWPPREMGPEREANLNPENTESTPGWPGPGHSKQFLAADGEHAVHSRPPSELGRHSFPGC